MNSSMTEYRVSSNRNKKACHRPVLNLRVSSGTDLHSVGETTWLGPVKTHLRGNHQWMNLGGRRVTIQRHVVAGRFRTCNGTVQETDFDSVLGIILADRFLDPNQVAPRLGPRNSTTKAACNRAQDAKRRPQEPQTTQAPTNETPSIKKTPTTQETWPRRTHQTHQLHPSRQE
jgi:hypothetical protein